MGQVMSDSGIAAPNGTASAGTASQSAGPDLGAARAQLREGFGNIVMAMMALPRYRHQSLADLQHLVLEPLLKDRLSIAYPPDREQNPLADSLGVAIWASVSDEAEARLQEQTRAGVFPLRLKPEDWTSGANHWLLDVIAPNPHSAAAVISNFRQLVPDGCMKIHPGILGLLDAETLRAWFGSSSSRSALPDPRDDLEEQEGVPK